MTPRWTARVVACCLLTGMRLLSVDCRAQELAQQGSSPQMNANSKVENARPPDTTEAAESSSKMQNPDTAEDGNGNAVGMPFVKNIFSDQETIWTSPVHLRWRDASWLLPFAEVTGSFFATDR